MEPVEIDIISAAPTTPKIRQQLKLNFIVGVLYLACLLGILCCVLLIPSSPASSKIYYTLYFTHYFEPSKLFYFFVLIFSGKVFLQAVVLKNFLKNSQRRIGGSPDNLWLFTCGIFAYILGGNATLFSWSEYVSYTDAILYNFCGYTLPFFMFLHSAYVLSGVLIQVNLSFGDLYKVSKKSFLISLIIVLTLIGLCGYQFYLLYQYSRLYIYLIIYSVIGFLAGIIYFCCRDSHHFNLFSIYCLLIVPLTATPTLTSQILQSSLLGLYLENSARIGFSNLIIKK